MRAVRKRAVLALEKVQEFFRLVGRREREPFDLFLARVAQVSSAFDEDVRSNQGPVGTDREDEEPEQGVRDDEGQVESRRALAVGARTGSDGHEPDDEVGRPEAVGLTELEARPGGKLADKEGKEAQGPQQEGEQALDDHAGLEEQDSGRSEHFVARERVHAGKGRDVWQVREKGDDDGVVQGDGALLARSAVVSVGRLSSVQWTHEVELDIARCEEGERDREPEPL